MLASGFPGRGYLSAASPMLVALCTCVIGKDVYFIKLSFGAKRLKTATVFPLLE